MNAEILYQDDDFVVFRDINPKARVHLLVVPKHHIESINHLSHEHQGLIGQMFLLVKKIAEDQGFAKDGYRLIFNVGRGAGQVIDHLHLHILSGKMGEMP